MLQIKNGHINPPVDEPLENIVNISNLADYCRDHRISIWATLQAKTITLKKYSLILTNVDKKYNSILKVYLKRSKDILTLEKLLKKKVIKQIGDRAKYNRLLT